MNGVMTTIYRVQSRETPDGRVTHSRLYAQRYAAVRLAAKWEALGYYSTIEALVIPMDGWVPVSGEDWRPLDYDRMDRAVGE